MKAAQQGMTLIEVLVAFVIFTSSLVAVLDYVANQVFHRQRTLNQAENVVLVYDLASQPDVRLHVDSLLEGVEKGIHWQLESRVVNVIERRGKTTTLYKQLITAERVNNVSQKKPFKWHTYVVVAE